MTYLKIPFYFTRSIKYWNPMVKDFFFELIQIYIVSIQKLYN